ncbi:MAG: hypothetical protein LBH59_07960 [Planctomycetaceae bacterium]|jgi:hypothetical protein|nr:hypothetical protein [Planctomycetaceae bacterium]
MLDFEVYLVQTERRCKMAAHAENHDNPGIFIRFFEPDNYEVFWTDGHGIIEMAMNEETLSSDTINDYLEECQVDNFAREMYSPWGEFEGVTTLRQITLNEAVHYLGRHAKVCAFLRPKVQALRFVRGLEKRNNIPELEVAAAIRNLIGRFDELPEENFTKSGLFRLMENQLLNITTNN